MMRITRRTFMLGAGAGAMTMLLASCTPEPAPTKTPKPTKTSAPPSPIPVPEAFRRSTWSTDPFAHGAASFTPVGVQSGLRETLAEPVERRVFLAGEATDAEAPGTMRGALASGTRAAEDVITFADPGERIAVIGAGLAGAAAAERLIAAGVEVTVFEARDRIGGRIRSVVDDTWPVVLHGGGWLLDTGDDELLGRMHDADMRLVSLDTTGWYDAEGVETSAEPVADDPFAAAVETAANLPADVSLADALAESGADPDSPEVKALLAYCTSMSGADAAQASAWFPPVVPRGTLTAPLGDPTPFLEAALEGATLSLSSAVSRIAYDDSGLSLRLGTGESLSFDRVVVTAPLGVLQQQGIEFEPPLPFSHRGAIASLGMGRIETVWMSFDEPFWDTEASLWHFLGDDVAVPTWINLAPATGDNVLVGIVGGERAGALSELDDDAAFAAAAESLARFVDEPAAP